jgi:2-polyprenyl-3-methyl-5-hydroxy-6-metoxy-1,4-benzoquinol methylase
MRAAPSGNCHVCGTGGRLLHRGVRDRLYGVPGEWNFRRCENRACGVVWLDPMPIETDLHEAYADYYTHADERSDPGAAHGASSARVVVNALEQLWLGALGLKSARHRIDAMFLDDVPPGRVLDVGCGDGRLLAALRDRGWIVEGQETDAAAAENTRRTRDLTVHLGDLRHLALPAASFDAVIMNHVIEHAYDPTALVGECLRLLKPGGAFVATTPNPEGFGHLRFGKAWRGLDPPRHLHLVSPAALAAVARAAGFREWRVWTTPARAGGMLAASRDISRSGKDRLLGRIEPLHLAAAAWYQLLARIAHARRADSGEEAVLKAFR